MRLNLAGKVKSGGSCESCNQRPNDTLPGWLDDRPSPPHPFGTCVSMLTLLTFHSGIFANLRVFVCL